MSTATSTQTSSTECPSTESSTTAADPVLTREEAIAILAGPGQRTAGTFKTRRVRYAANIRGTASAFTS